MKRQVQNNREIDSNPILRIIDSLAAPKRFKNVIGVIILLSVFLSFSHVYGNGETDLRALLLECREAVKSFRKVKTDFYYKVLHSVEYEGFMSDGYEGELVQSVHMYVQFAGASKKGHLWFANKPERKFSITLRSDPAGNCEIVAENFDNTYGQMLFTGLMKEGTIKGAWKNYRKSGRIIPFYVRALESKP